MKKVRKKRPPRTTRTSTKPRSWARSSRSRPKKKRSSEPRRPARAAYLGLGSNLGNRRANLIEALAQIARLARIRRVSSFYRSEPVGYARQPFFYNAVARIAWPGTARSLLSRVKGIERRLGRVPTFRNGPRVIDIDVLDLGGAVERGADPILPHPALPERRFVLAPLAEIAPAWRHPVSGLTARQMLAKLPRRPRVRRLRRAG
ncbi:MAG: 2-amino-4-hydroxy-6-hydroxymethyldihydropteridine diphosphokinase [Acidobacteriota bacterium]